MAAEGKRMSPQGEIGRVREKFLQEFARLFYHMVVFLSCLAPKYILSVKNHTLLLGCY